MYTCLRSSSGPLTLANAFTYQDISPAPNFLNLKIVIMYNKITLLLNSERQKVRQIDRKRQTEEEGESDVMSSSISVQVFETGSLY